MIKPRNLVAFLLIAGLVALVGPAFGEMCTMDAVPAATLLVPYFEVDLDACGDAANQASTLFSINNASAAPALAHVTLWTNYSQPTLDFDVFLTGYDVQSINIADVFCDGNLPITADLANDGADTISPNSGHLAWDGTFPGCGSIFPFYVNPMVTGTRLSDLGAAHTGGATSTGVCPGHDVGDNMARGYITVDNASRCSLIFPDDPDYFDDGTGSPLTVATNVNQLWGDWFLVDPANNFAQGDNLVHVEAQDLFFGGTNDYTFYSRYTFWNGDFDHREPLGETWGARYINGGAFDGSELVVWRDSTSNEIIGDCGGPAWYPMNETQVIAFDEQEDAEELCFASPGGVISPPDPGSDTTCFPLETQRVPTGVEPLNPTFNFGWMFMNLNADDVLSAGDDYDPAGQPWGLQSYVTVLHSAQGLYSAGMQAMPLSSACDMQNGVIVGWE